MDICDFDTSMKHKFTADCIICGGTYNWNYNIPCEYIDTLFLHFDGIERLTYRHIYN